MREVCDRHGVLLILDEVMCGMGRTGTLHACEQEGIVPDLMTIAKGLGGGYQPIGAVLAQQRIVDAMSAGSGILPARPHLSRSSGRLRGGARGPAGDRARRSSRQGARARGVVRGAARRGASAATRTSATFAAAASSSRSSSSRDRATKATFDPALTLHARIKREAMARGLMVYPMGGTIDGRAGDHVLLAPPFIVEEEHLDIIVDRLAQAIDAAIQSL